MMKLVDQIGREVTLNKFPGRIISLVPSQTELLYDLGLNEEVTGITKFCTIPVSWFHQKIKIGGTKNLNIRKIEELRPDLILANKEENEKDQIEALGKFAPVWTSDVTDLESALEMIKSIGNITDRSERSARIISQIAERFLILNRVTSRPGISQLSVAYLIWYNPLMVAGGDCFINDMLSKAGFTNCFSSRSRYPKVDIEEIKQLSPALIFLSSEPFPFTEKHKREFEILFPDAAIVPVDGAMFSWYGSRLLFSPGYFQSLHGPAWNV